MHSTAYIDNDKDDIVYSIAYTLACSSIPFFYNQASFLCFHCLQKMFTSCADVAAYLLVCILANACKAVCLYCL